MARVIANVISKKEFVPLVIEAGTGVGKTFAYLIPAILSGKQTIISTGSKNLQEQLFNKDLPALLTMLGLNPKIALLKGRNNYLCHLNLARQLDAAHSHEPQYLDELLRIKMWASMSADGDIGTIATVSEQSLALKAVTSSKETCTGKRCEFYDVCFIRNARKKTENAALIVINHHLFFADYVLKDTGFAELLPNADIVIFDEAHLLADIAINYFGQQLSLSSLMRLLTRIEQVYQQQLKDTIQLSEFTKRCSIKLADWIQILLGTHAQDWRALLTNKNILQKSKQFLDDCRALEKILIAHANRSNELDDCLEKWAEYINKLEVFINCDNPHAAYNIEQNHTSITLSITPINIAPQCHLLFNGDTKWIFTSATLQVNRELKHFCQSLGIEQATESILDSPFNYAEQAMLCVPRQLGNVNANDEYHLNKLVSICEQAINAAQGRTFILFTSHRMLQQVAHLLTARTSYPLLIQGTGSKQSLLTKYRQLGNAVLLGTGSFWEGVDVSGTLLSCVIIDKLPFVSPDNTLYRARATNVLQRGGDPFTEVILPQAVIALKQGVGRLIRGEKDKGVLIICDNRLVNRAYGQVFLNSLPAMSRTRDLENAFKIIAGY